MNPVEICYFTDPLCSWSWAMEPQWRRLRHEFGNQLVWRYRMGGLIASWRSYHDSVNAISRPSQMGPYWLYVRHLSGQPIDERVWRDDPPSSSFPACLAVKAAERQGPAAAEAYLRALREAIMLDRRNIARREVLEAVAEELAVEPGVGVDFDVQQFRDDLRGADVQDAFRDDLKEAAYRGISRYPTLVIRREDGLGVVCVGYRPYAALRTALAYVAPDVMPMESTSSLEQYLHRWRRLTLREIAEGLEMDAGAARQVLEGSHLAVPRGQQYELANSIAAHVPSVGNVNGAERA